MVLPLDDGHTLNVQAVELRTGVTAETLRTWERRYGWPRPSRLPNGYRVYSEDDVALILAVKRELDGGVAAATAWQRVLSARQRRPLQMEAGRPAERLAGELVVALLAFDQETSATLIAEAHGMLPLEQVLTQVIQPALVEVGTRWHEGQATIAQEHFASNALRDGLITISNYYKPRPGAATIMIGSGPGELHDIGVLMLTVLLRRSGHKVLYLGQNLGLDQLGQSLEQIRPRMLVLSASRLETARQLAAVAPMVQRLSPPRPLFAFGGRAFEGHPELAERIGGTYVAGNAVQSAVRLEELLSSGPRA